MSKPAVTEHFRCKNGETVHIEIKDDGTAARVFTPGGREIGGLEFEEYDDNSLVLVWANLENTDKRYVRQGIGRKCVQMLADYNKIPLLARFPDGQRREEGGHLTGDAPAFVQAMIREGLINYVGDFRGSEEREPF